MRLSIAVLLTAIFAVGATQGVPARALSLNAPLQGQKIFGVMDDNPVMAAASEAGFNVVKRSVWIAPTNNSWDNAGSVKGVEPLPAEYRQVIIAAMADARKAGVKVILELYPITKFGPPKNLAQMKGTCDLARDMLDQFPEVMGVEIGVEPNSSTFGGDQFNPDGTQASAALNLKWLAICYYKIKAKHPDVLVIGGSLSSRGEDQPYKETSDTSPVLWIQKFCQAYKSSGLTRPVMDWFDMHSYPDPEDQDPAVQHPYPSTTITIADYDKLDALLACFNGTAQPKPPILWGETGYNTDVPTSMVGKNYSKDAKPSTVRLVDEPTQGRYAANQIQMAYCQANSVGWINFHFVDDANRFKDWQSGFAYAPGRTKRSSSGATGNYTLKQSMPPVRQALAAVNNGTMKCGPPGSP